MNELRQDEDLAARIRIYDGPVPKTPEAPATGRLVFEVIGPAVGSLFSAGTKVNRPLS